MRKSPILVGIVCLTPLCLGAGATPGGAAEEWKWPEKGQNLQVLPADFPPEKLRAVMRGFSRALGVRCTHCHVGKEGEPLSRYDFASDANPKKDVARQMYRMLGAINKDHLAKMQGLSQPGLSQPGVNMWCHTCHAGRARPMTLEEDLLSVHRAQGKEAALARYRELRERYQDRGAYDFGPESLSGLAGTLAGDGKDEDALAFLRLNAEQNPDAALVWTDLGRAYRKLGRKPKALVYLEKSLAIDPEQPGVASAIEELRAPGAAAGP